MKYNKNTVNLIEWYIFCFRNISSGRKKKKHSTKTSSDSSENGEDDFVADLKSHKKRTAKKKKCNVQKLVSDKENCFSSSEDISDIDMNLSQLKNNQKLSLRNKSDSDEEFAKSVERSSDNDDTAVSQTTLSFDNYREEDDDQSVNSLHDSISNGKSNFSNGKRSDKTIMSDSDEEKDGKIKPSNNSVNFPDEVSNDIQSRVNVHSTIKRKKRLFVESESDEDTNMNSKNIDIGLPSQLIEENNPNVFNSITTRRNKRLVVESESEEENITTVETLIEEDVPVVHDRDLEMKKISEIVSVDINSKRKLTSIGPDSVDSLDLQQVTDANINSNLERDVKRKKLMIYSDSDD